MDFTKTELRKNDEAERLMVVALDALSCAARLFCAAGRPEHALCVSRARGHVLFKLDREIACLTAAQVHAGTQETE